MVPARVSALATLGPPSVAPWSPRTTTSGVRTIDGGDLGAVARSREQQLGTTPPGLEELLADGREPDVVGDLDVVVADDRQVVGDAQARLVRGADDAQGLRVAGGEDGGRTLGGRRAVGGQLARLVAAVRSERDQVGPAATDRLPRSARS